MKPSNIRALVLAAFVVFAAQFTASGEARANHYRAVWYGWHGGAAVAWGWYGPWSPSPVYVPYYPYGYSYWGFYNYQPYYSTYAVISYSPSANKVGLAYGQPSVAQAASVANAYCGVADCRGIVWVQGGCAAVSSAADGSHMTWAYHPQRSVAEYYAMVGCNRSSGNTGVCAQRAWVCSF